MSFVPDVELRGGHDDGVEAGQWDLIT